MDEGRVVNERLLGLNEPFSVLLGTYSVVCECDDARCNELIEIPADVYSRVRMSGECVVHAGHVRGGRIVASRDGWAVVQK